MDELDAPLSGGVGASSAALLAAEPGLGTVRDLLRHLPRRHAERAQLTPLGQLVNEDPGLERHRALAAAVADRVSGDTERFLERA